ncbi:MAG TPA: TetR/AcrR family transcriptional regulator [Steroidobacteraceae bacterium]|jgi:TetR/AcrR family transcriptional repressor of nem operon
MVKIPKQGGGPKAPTAAARAILDAAEMLAQTRGYNGFSYADVAVQLGVTKASLHYHFPSKTDLGRALLERYHAAFAHGLDTIDQAVDEPCEKLERYVRLYDAVLVSDRMCLCGMFAAEYVTLPEQMQAQLHAFFDANERWLTTVLEQGRRARRFAFNERAHERARVLLGALEGAMLIARSYGDPQRFRVAARHLLADLCKSSPGAVHGGSVRRPSRRT